MSTLLDIFETEQSPPRTGQIFFWCSLAVVVVLLLGILAFVALRLMPDSRQRAALNLYVMEGRERLADAEQLAASLPARYRSQLEGSETRLTQTAGDFLAESQPARLLDRFNAYSRAAGVEIVDLQIQPSPATEAHTRRVFALRVLGPFDGLLDFLSRIEEVALPGLVLSDIQITAEAEERFALSMNATMFTSVYAAEQPQSEAETALSRSAQPVAPLASPEELADLQTELDTAWAANDWATAVETAAALHARLPEHPDVIETLYRAHVNYGYHLLATHQVQEAEAQFAAALDVKPTGKEALGESRQLADNPTLIHLAEGQLVDNLQVATQAGDWREAIRLLRLLQTVNPMYEGLDELLYDAYMSYGAQLEAAGRPDLAQEQYNQAQAIRNGPTPNGEAAPNDETPPATGP